MKKRRILSATLVLAVILTLLPVGWISAFAATEGTQPPRLPGDPTTIYKWGHYPDANGVYKVWYGTELGTLGAGNGSPAETWDQSYALRPIVSPETTLSCTQGESKLVGGSYDKSFGSLEAKISEDAAGLMLRVSTNASYTGFVVDLYIDGLPYSYNSRGIAGCNGKIYHYDYASETWKVEATAGTNARLPLNYDGYVFIPFNGFYVNGAVASDTTLADNMDLLSEKGISRIRITTPAWNEGAAVTLHSVDVVTLSDRIVGASPILADGVDLRVRASIGAGAETASIIFEIEDVAEPITVTINDPIPGDNYFTLRNLLKSQNMSRNIRMTLEVDGETVDVIEEYSIRDYAMKMLGRETSSKTLKLLLVDMLTYGAASQSYTDYKTDDLADAALNALQQGMISPIPTESDIVSTKEISGDSAACDWKTFSLILNNEFSLRLTFAAPTVEGMVVLFDGVAFTPEATETAGVYSVRIDGMIAAKNFTEAYEVTLYDTASSCAVGETLCISASAYVKSILSNPNATEVDKQLAAAAYNYAFGASLYAPTTFLDEDYVIQYFGVSLSESDALEREEAVGRFLEELEHRTGLALSVGTASGDKMIKISANGFNTKTGYEIYVEGNTITVDCYDTALLDDALETLLNQLGTSAAISSTYSAILGAPLYYGTGTPDAHIFSAGNGAYMQYIYEADEASFLAYCEDLTAYYDYELYTEHRMGEQGSESVFATYRNAHRTVYVVWNPVDRFIRITDSPAHYFVPDGQRDEYVAITDTTLAQISREDVVNAQPGNAVGLGLIWQLADGRFIMVDGGPNYAGTDPALTYAYLMDNKPASHDKPIIAGWFFTHEHGDHTWLAKDFMIAYHEQVEIELIGVNYPDFEDFFSFHSESTYTGEHTGFTMGTLGAVQQFYPDATVWIMRAGQKHWIGNAEIEVILSQEDLYDMTKNTEASDRGVQVNDTDCVFRITAGGKSTMVLGDSEGQTSVDSTTGAPTSLYLANDLMAKWYGSYLESDILQTAHHGINEGLALYQAVNPTTVFWPTGSWSACNKNRLANKWLYNGVEYNGLTTRATAHYFSSVDTVITLEKCPGKIELPMFPL